MKRKLILLLNFCIVFICVSFVSCNDDNEENEPDAPIQEDVEITPGQEVDLGLPSGTIWAGWNVGASSPEEYGGYYAWGETEEKSNYSMGTYKYFDSHTGKLANIGTNISGTQYDVARQKWGGSWRMPTQAEFSELTSKCTWTWCEYKGVNGYKVTGPNGNSIFLPAAGSRCCGTSLYRDGSHGYYWNAMLAGNYYDWDSDDYDASNLYFGNVNYCSSYYHRRYDGLSVRPIK